MWKIFFTICAILLILLILAALLFPKMDCGPVRSMDVFCGQNLRQIVIAVRQFEMDKGYYPAGRHLVLNQEKAQQVTNMINWYNAISSYMHADPKAQSAMGNPDSFRPVLSMFSALQDGDRAERYPEAFRCYARKEFDMAGINMSYGYNYQYLGNADLKSVVLGKDVAGYVNYPVSSKAIPRPDRTIVVADSDGTGSEAYQSLNAGLPKLQNLGAFGYLLDPAFLPAKDLDGDGSIDAIPGKSIGPAAGGLIVNEKAQIAFNGANAAEVVQQRFRSIASNRHSGRCNVAFLDGHIEQLPRESLYFQVYQAPNSPIVLYPSNALWNGYGQDNDPNGNGKIELNLGESLIDPNEAFPSLDGLNPLMRELYNPNATPNSMEETSISFQLAGPYAKFGPGFDAKNPEFLKGKTGPTLPHHEPFDFSYAVGIR